jgi:hypothetical protein
MTTLTWSPDLRASVQMSKQQGSKELVNATNLTLAERNAASKLLNGKNDVSALFVIQGSWA